MAEVKEEKGKKESQTTFRPYKAEEFEEKPSVTSSASRRDIFLMSLLSFLIGGAVVLIALFFAGAITGDVNFSLSGEGEVNESEENITVIEPVISDTTDVTENITTETETVEEETVEEVVEEDPCGVDMTLSLDTSVDYNGKEITLKLADDTAAQITVGGKKDLLSVGETKEINNLNIYLSDSSPDGTAIIQVVC